MLLITVDRLVSGAGDIKLTKDGKVLLSEMVYIIHLRNVWLIVFRVSSIRQLHSLRELPQLKMRLLAMERPVTSFLLVSC